MHGTSDLPLFQRKMKHLRSLDFLPEPLLALVEDVHRAQLEAYDAARPAGAPAERLSAPDTRAQGAPVLPREHFPWDQDQAAGLFQTFLERLALLGEGPAQAAATIAQALDEAARAEAMAKYVEEDDDYFAAWAERTPEAPMALRFLVQAALTPGLAKAAAGLGPLEDAHSGHGVCPVCGSAPLIARLDGKEGARRCTCSFCQTDYRARRLDCLYCGEDDHNKLGYFKAEEEPGFRVELCGTCQLYIKTVDFRDLDRPSLPMLDDLESLPLDMLARERGYQRPTLSGWGF